MASVGTLPAPPDVRPPLVCTCSVDVVDRLTGDVIRVRGARWDCPSCGANKRAALTEMVESAAAVSGGRYSFLTMTYAPVMDWVWGVSVPPVGHYFFDIERHVVWVIHRNGTGRWVWRVMADCGVCLRRDTASFIRWRKRIQRRWPTAVFLVVREAHKDGALHLHVIVAGMPFVIRPRSRAERLAREHWVSVGGGRQLDASVGKRGSPRRAGRYVAKYASKALGVTKSARRFRLWRRSRGFGSEVRMFGYRPRKAVRLEPCLETRARLGDPSAFLWEFVAPAGPPPAWVDWVDQVAEYEREARQLVESLFAATGPTRCDGWSVKPESMGSKTLVPQGIPPVRAI